MDNHEIHKELKRLTEQIESLKEQELFYVDDDALLSSKTEALQNQLQQLQSELDTEYTDYPICPHCGYKETDLEGFESTDDMEETYCNNCGKDFEYSVFVSWSFTTQKKES